MKQVDARGMACPKPVVMTKNALDGLESGLLTVLVDNPASVANVTRFARSRGWDVTEQAVDDHVELVISRGDGDALPETVELSRENTGNDRAIVYITSDQVGPDEELGRHLLKVFIRNMLEVSRAELPGKIIFVNRGVRVPCSWEETIEDLKALVGMGVEVYACGVCLKHYDIMDDLQVGEVGNAFDTVQAFLGNGKLVTIC